MPGVSLTAIAPRWLVRPPSLTARLRLTLLYGALFLGSGAVLLAITYLLVRQSGGNLLLSGSVAPKHLAPAPGSVLRHVPSQQLPGEAQRLRDLAAQQHTAELHRLLVRSGIALAIMAVISTALGWLVAGRVLRPVRMMTATTRRISDRNLHERLALEGPRDEMRDLAETIDGLLARLETSFDAQRRFAANAAHELRTPLTLLRALLEETLTDPDATIESFRVTAKRLLAIGEEQERLLAALLILASSERGLEHRERFDLSVLADTILLRPRSEAQRSGVRIAATIAPAPTAGDASLALRLVANLIDNAVRHNVPGGHVEVSTGIEDRWAFLCVANTGPAIPADELERLFEPFARLSPDRTAHNGDHHGLGLSIVRAIATAHHATIMAEPLPEGGLMVKVRFPLDDSRPDDDPALDHGHHQAGRAGSSRSWGARRREAPR